jgi:hypothetical protein
MAYLYGALTLAPALLMLPLVILAIPNDSIGRSDPSPEMEEGEKSEIGTEGRDKAYA